MMFFERLRNKIFWLKDSMTNSSRIKNNLNEIRNLNQAPFSDESQDRIHRLVLNLLNYAVSNTKFYQQFDSTALNHFPVINKTIIKNHLDEFLTADKNSLKSSSTSGSTGLPLTVYQDDEKVNRHIADMIYSNEIAGYRLGEKLYYFRVWNQINAKNKLLTWLQNIEMIDSATMSATKFNSVFKLIAKKQSGASILSFASSLEALADYIKQDLVSIDGVRLNGIIAMSESLPNLDRNFLSEKMNCSVVSRYSNMENGFIAQQRKDSDEYYINWASFYVEILKMDQDAPTEFGEMGRIVVTDLFNYGMPIIRYDTGDIGVMEKIDDTLVLKSVEGRKTDFIYNTQGDILSPHIITNTMWFFSDQLDQFQFIQHKTNRYEMKLNLKNDKISLDENRLISLLKNYLGDDAYIELNYVSEIPVLSSGKRKKVMNLMS